ncbi:uncharacterized protein LOC126848100 [Cataglyphis hispanica]|uniref:uncharacterized protein LOC126848100 n=1 Tax=Cataglyphis hispanica TaxID=1086592 RepID=UPI00217F8E9A|nr:uncharacterized protein LOC126848100 [Cataglyphis hispanica]
MRTTTNIMNKMRNFKPSLQITILYISILSYISRAQAEGISCFKCLMTPTRPEDTNLLCAHFDGSAKFQTFCPTSTLCMKKTVQYKSKTSVVTTVQRDCTPQKYISYVYSDVDKQWHKKEEIITTAYDEGCFIGEHRGAPTGPPEYCFCSFHLCNSSPSLIGMFNKICGTILALLIIKLM